MHLLVLGVWAEIRWGVPRSIHGHDFFNLILQFDFFLSHLCAAPFPDIIALSGTSRVTSNSRGESHHPDLVLSLTEKAFHSWPCRFGGTYPLAGSGSGLPFPVCQRISYHQWILCLVKWLSFVPSYHAVIFLLCLTSTSMGLCWFSARESTTFAFPVWNPLGCGLWFFSHTAGLELLCILLRNFGLLLIKHQSEVFQVSVQYYLHGIACKCSLCSDFWKRLCTIGVMSSLNVC